MSDAFEPSAYEEGRIRELVRDWAFGHPRAQEPFLALMGRTLTPHQFNLEVVEDPTPFGRSFVDYLVGLVRRGRIDDVTEPLKRAIDANYGAFEPRP